MKETSPARADVSALPGLLVEPSWLKEQVGHPSLRVVDLRDAEAYASGHVRGAVHLELGELGSNVGALDNVLLPADAFAALMSARGISNGDAVVAYDDQWGLAASRLVWALHYYGHARVGLLDGGWDRWQAEDGPVATGAESIAPGSFDATPTPDVFADRDWIAGRVAAGDVVLVDTRTKREFDAGHLPGAILWDWFSSVPADSWDASRDPAELREEWAGLGINASDEVTVYCRSGMRAAHTWVALRNAGFPRVRLYDGSWQEWSMKKDEVDGR